MYKFIEARLLWLCPRCDAAVVGEDSRWSSGVQESDADILLVRVRSGNVWTYPELNNNGSLGKYQHYESVKKHDYFVLFLSSYQILILNMAYLVSFSSNYVVCAISKFFPLKQQKLRIESIFQFSVLL